MAHFTRTILKTLFICFFLLPGINGCKDDYTSVVPYVYVNTSINPTNIIELNIPGGSWYYPNMGFGGIILFRDLADTPTFFAFDATCTYEVSSMIRVVADGSGLATCPKCKSQFILFGGNGSPANGPAIEPLKQYRTSYSGSRINIRN
jgi:nitrite reductase/ring-hydroxylating ferredoxin subunit